MSTASATLAMLSLDCRLRASGMAGPEPQQAVDLDLAVDDIAAAEARALELGATAAVPQPGETWRVLLDPAGHPICLTRRENWR